jgi:site-specific recombinase XerD
MTLQPPIALLTALLSRLDGAYAPSTLRAYRADMEEFIRYCTDHGLVALPADPISVAGFLMDTATTGIKSSTIRRKESSISAIHRLSYLADPTKHPEVRIAIRKVERKLGTQFGQAYPIDQKLLQNLLAVCGDDLRGLRDRALLLLAYDSLRRRSELVTLRLEDIEPNSNGCAVILLRRGKTDQTGRGCWIAVSPKTHRAIKKWMAAAKIEYGFILRSVRRGRVGERLSPGQINRILKKLARAAGLEERLVTKISGHSTRVGRAQDLLKVGASLPQMMHAGGWTKPDTVMRYVARIRPSAASPISIDFR